MKDFRKRWREKTDCRAGFVTTECTNGPDADADPAAAQRRAVTAHERARS